MDPFKLLKAITRLHFVSYDDNDDAMEEEVYDKLDDIHQGTHEALGVYTARFKDCVTTFSAIGWNHLLNLSCSESTDRRQCIQGRQVH